MNRFLLFTCLLFATPCNGLLITIPAIGYAWWLGGSIGFAGLLEWSRHAMPRNVGAGVTPKLDQGTFTNSLHVSKKGAQVVALCAKAGKDSFVSLVEESTFHKSLEHFFASAEESPLCISAKCAYDMYLDGQIPFQEASPFVTSFINAFKAEAWLEFSLDWKPTHAFGGLKKIPEFVEYDGLVVDWEVGDALITLCAQQWICFLGLLMYVFHLIFGMPRLVRSVKLNTSTIERLVKLFLDHEGRISTLENQVAGIHKVLGMSDPSSSKPCIGGKGCPEIDFQAVERVD